MNELTSQLCKFSLKMIVVAKYTRIFTVISLRRRFIFMGLMNQLAAPFIVIFNLITFFLDHLVVSNNHFTLTSKKAYFIAVLSSLLFAEIPVEPDRNDVTSMVALCSVEVPRI